jgi:hypothetical protein
METLPPLDDPDYPDPIVDQVRALRRQMDAEKGNDLKGLFADLRRRERESGRSYVTFGKDAEQPAMPLPLASDSAASAVSR